MKRSICLIMTVILLLMSFASCAPSEVVRNVDGEFEAKDGELYVAYVYVEYVDDKGFEGRGTFSDGVYVVYPDADKSFDTFNTVRVEFYGENYKVEDNSFEYQYGDGYPLHFTSKQTITAVKNARRSGGNEGEPVYDKPIIYFYPEEDTVCSVKIDIDGKLTCAYPEYKNGWSDFTAHPDGTLTFPDGSEYYALYWEGEGRTELDMSKGFCVKGEDTAAFLADILPKLGLTAREANEFIIYWLPLMQDNEYNLISFQSEAYTDSAKLIIDPAPDTLIRVFMAWQALDEYVETEAQEIVTPERVGFTVVEWGGSEIK